MRATMVPDDLFAVVGCGGRNTPKCNSIDEKWIENEKINGPLRFIQTHVAVGRGLPLFTSGRIRAYHCIDGLRVHLDRRDVEGCAGRHDY